ncbi:MAG: carboxypeptidase regulatory-like domain-containing protein [Bryobacteraceae bacterium]
MLRMWMRATLLLTFASLAMAQTNVEITGRVVDPTGAQAPGAVVTATNTQKRTQRTTTSNEEGYYTLTALEPGTYEVTVELAGFRRMTSSGNKLDVNQSLRLDFTLVVGEVAERIQVTGETVAIETNTGQLGTVMTEEKIANLPLNARNFSQLLSLTPGAAPVSVAQNNQGGQTTQRIGVLVFPAVNGQTNRSNSFTLDGVYNNGHFTGTYTIAPNIDALSQFKVQSHSDQAEFGGVTGGVVNIATKSGTNELHGSLFEFLRNDKLDARGFFAAAKPPLRQNQFGGTVGGPVLKNRTFFFVSYEGYRQVNGSSILSLIPTPAQLGGDFSGVRQQLYDPYSTRTDPQNATRFLRDPYASNRIPAARLSPSIKAFADAIIPQPVATAFAAFNALNTDSQNFPADNYSARADHYVSTRDWIWFRYNWSQGNQRQALAFPHTVNVTNIPAKNMGASYTHTFGASTVFSALFGFSSTTYNDAPTFTDRDLIGEGYFKGYPVDPRTLAPGVNLPGYFSLSMRNRHLGPQRGWQQRADLAHSKGRHSFKFGGDLVTQPWSNFQITDTLTYSPRPTADLNNLGNTGHTLASFVMGLQDQALLSISGVTMKSQIFGFYAQDSWKVTDRLTLNYGLRWDIGRPPTLGQSFITDWDFNTGKFLVGLKDPAACSAVGNKPPCIADPNNAYVKQYVVFTGKNKVRADEYGLLGPRLGAAYRLGNKTVVRGSFAILYDLMSGLSQQGQNAQAAWPGLGGGTLNTNTTLVTTTSDSPFGAGGVSGITAFVSAPTPAAVAGFHYDPNFRDPYSMQWNVEIQREIEKNLTLSVGYVGSHSLRLAISGDYNTALTPGPGAVAPRALWPHAPVSSWDRSTGQSKYNALQTKVERRFASGFSFLGAYTWSKSMDVASSGQFNENISIQNPYDPNASRSVSGFDIPHVFSLAAVYALPFGRGRAMFHDGVLSRVLGNWQVNGIFTARSGQPFTPQTNLDIANIGALTAATRVRPDLVGDPHLDNPTPAQWFNKAAFRAPAQYTFGNAGRNILRSDSLEEVAFSFFREDAIGERMRLQFRAEAFNLLNHPTFGLPDAITTGGTFGAIGGTVSNARQIQLGLKLLF